MRTRAKLSKRLAGLMTVGLIAGLLPGFYAPALAAVHCVNPGGTGGCDDTIQEAVDGAAPGDTINVTAGSYAEQVVVDKNLTITGAGENFVTIAAPGSVAVGLGNVNNIVAIDGADVVLSGVTVSGPGPSGIGSLIGIGVYNAGNLDLSASTIEQIRPPTMGGAQQFVGVAVGDRYSNLADGIGEATVNDVTVSDYQKNGISAYGLGSLLDVTDSSMTGVGSTGLIAQNGVLFMNGAQGSVTGSTIQDHIYTGPDESSGAILFGANPVTLTDNDITNNQIGIYANSTSPVVHEAHGNRIDGNTVYGIQAEPQATVDAEDNWWGDPSGPSGVGPGSGDAVSAGVDYDPWCVNDTCSPPPPATFVVDDNVIGQPSDCAGTPNSTHTSVPAAVAAAGAGDTIRVCQGTFALGAPTLYFNFDDMTLQGEGPGVTTLTSSSTGTSTGNWAIANKVTTTGPPPGDNGPDGLTFRGFSLTHLPNNLSGGFAMHFYGSDNGTIENVSVSGFWRTGVDINTSTNWDIDNVSSTGAGFGNGFQTTDAHDITYNDITATGNAWGGVGVFTRGFDGPHGTDGIVFTGNNTLDGPGKNPAINLEGYDEFDQANPVPITYSNDPLDGAEVTVQASDVNFAYEGRFHDNPGVRAHYYSALYATLAEARDAATPPEWKPLDPGTIRNITTGEYYPLAPGDPVDPGPGGTVTTDEGAGQPTPSDPQTTSVQSPNGGPVTITESDTHTQPPPGTDYQFFGQEVNISAPDATPADPLVITFKFDASTFPVGFNPDLVIVRRSGVEVPDCAGGNGTTADPDPCVESRTIDGNGDLVIVVYTSQASPWDFLTPVALCTISGTPGDDIIHGTPGDDVICGLGGNDTIYGEGGNDELHGQGDNDTLYGGNGNDLMFGGDGNDDFFGGGGNDEMYGGIGNDRMWGNFGGDEMYGGNDDDLIVGRFGNDTIEGGDGNDTIIGGDGNDVIDAGEGHNDVYAGIGSDFISAGSGNDRLRGGGGSDFIVAGDGNNEILAGDGDNFVFSGTGNDYVDAGLGSDVIQTGGGDDDVFAGHGTNNINVGDGNNYVLSGTGPDTVTSGTGNDVIETGLGDDVVTSGGGNDDLLLGDGANFANAGDGNNYVLGGPSADLIITGTGNDRIDGEGGNNLINAGDGDNAVFAGNGNNIVATGSGVDFISLGLGADTIFAGGGADVVYAGRGTNDINGDAGNDYLVGGEDNDDFDGGADTDTCDAGSLGFDTQVNCEVLIGTFP